MSPSSRETWGIDIAHSELRFTVRHLVISKVSGRFTRWRANVWLEPEVRHSAVEVVIDAASIDTGNEERDRHLRSAEFLDVERHPELSFHSREILPAGDGDYIVNGDLTIRGLTRPVTLFVTDHGRVRDDSGVNRAAFFAHGGFDRRDFGIRWHDKAGAGALIVGDEVEVHVEAEAVEYPETHPGLPEVASGGAANARARILAQHATIRTLLWAASSIASGALEGRTRAASLLPRYVFELRTTLQEHLACEETLVLPLLENDLPLGPARAAKMREEHARQRAELDALAASCGHAELRPVADSLRRLVTNLLIDMEQEEAHLLTPDVVRDDAVVVDQASG
jgi:polyisoprenoid-binding protein YceI